MLYINHGYLLRTGPMVRAIVRTTAQPAINQQTQRKTMALWMTLAAPLRAVPGFADCAARRAWPLTGGPRAAAPTS